MLAMQAEGNARAEPGLRLLLQTDGCRWTKTDKR